VIILLVWLWITNPTMLLGAELNAAIERGRAIEAGHDSETEPFLPTSRGPAQPLGAGRPQIVLDLPLGLKLRVVL
jgi:hypothetical protein